MSLSSCKKEIEEVFGEAGVELDLVSVTSSSVTFSIDPNENAVSVYYALAKVGENPDESEYVEIDDISGNVEISVSDLEENIDYCVTSFAINGAGKRSENTELQFKTGSAPVITVKTLSVTSSTAEFSVKALNAVSFWYGMAESSGIEDVEMVKIEDLEKNTVLLENLKENTSYTFVAYAESASGEQGEKVFTTIRTETEPAVKIESADIGSDEAKFNVAFENAVKYAYSVKKSDEEKPGEDDYREMQLTGTSATILTSGLESSIGYILYLYAITNKGYKGKVIEYPFETIEKVELAFDIVVSDVTSTNARIEVKYDSEIYGKYYFVSGLSSKIGDVTKWDWKKIIESGWSYPKYKTYEAPLSTDLRSTVFPELMSVESVYMIGAVPEKSRGELDLEAAVWKSVELPKVKFGESDAACSIKQISTSCDSFKFLVEGENSDCYYMTFTEGEQNAGMIDALAKKALEYNAMKNFGRDTIKDYLEPSKKYTFVAVPENEKGLGTPVSCIVETKSLDFEGPATADITVTELGQMEAVFGCVFGSSTVKVLYHYEEMNEYFDKTQFISSLKIGNYRFISESGDIKFENLDPARKYMFGFVPVDENGVHGKTVLLEESTKSFVFDGNPDAKVEMEIVSCEPAEFGMYLIKANAVPNDKVSKYFVLSVSEDNSYLTYDDFASQCVSGALESYKGENLIAGPFGKGFYVGKNASIWVLAYDSDGKMCKVSETRIEETWK